MEILQNALIRVANLSLSASYVIAAVLLARLLLQKMPKRYAYLLWSVVAFRLLCPFSFSAFFSLFNVRIFDLSAAQTSQGSLALIPNAVSSMSDPHVIVGIPAVSNQISSQLRSIRDASGVKPLEIFVAVSTLVWLLGILALLIHAIISYVRIRRQIAAAVHLNGSVFACDRIASPFVFGFFRPAIYIPFRLSATEQDYILRHERHHIRRGDHLIKPLAFLILVLHWFNPLVWLAFACMVRDMEMSCDEHVLLGLNHDVRIDYSRSLLALAAKRRWPVASPLTFGEVSPRNRIKNILNYRQPKTWAIVAAAAICIGIIMACAANPPAAELQLGDTGILAAQKVAIEDYLADREVDPGYSRDQYFCSSKIFASQIRGDQLKVYVWTRISAFDYVNQTLNEVCGSSIPYAVTLVRKNDNWLPISSQCPRDGTDYGRDMADIFPIDVRESMNASRTNGTMAGLETELRQKAAAVLSSAAYQTAHQSKIPMHALANAHFSLVIPAAWSYSEIPNNGGFYFDQSFGEAVGGIYAQTYQAVGGDSLPDIKNLIQWMLPNHSEIKQLDQLPDFPTDTWLVSLIVTPPAAQASAARTEWTYIIISDPAHSSANRFSAYEVFLNVNSGSQALAIEIARSVASEGY